MKYLLDTCVISDFIKNHKRTVETIDQLSPNELSISVITISEIEYGLKKIEGTKQGIQIERISRGLTSAIEVIEVDRSIAVMAGRTRAYLSKEGKNIGVHDLLIGVTAIERGLILVTSNVSEFARIEGLKIENWRDDNPKIGQIQ